MQQPLTNLERGLEILEPFLKHHDFEFDDFENLKSSDEEFFVATFKNGHKKFIVSYIGHVDYQFGNLRVDHDFYLNQLGFSDQKKFQNFQSDDKLLPFIYILHDFEFLIDDFFQGQCLKLKEYSKLYENIKVNYYKKTGKEFKVQFDTIRIEKARQEFGKKDFKKALEIYKRVENKNLLNDLDKKIIEHCNQYSK